MDKILRIAVVSDLHCHNLNNNLMKDGSPYQESLILTDKKTPIFQNPFESLKYLIEEEVDRDKYKVDLLFMPGDITNKACPEGIEKGYEILREMKALFGADHLISNIGNHDIDSRKVHNSEPLDSISKLPEDYPFDNKKWNQTFWKKGYAVLDFEDFIILAVNSVHNHVDVANVDHGYVDLDTLQVIDKELSKIKKDRVGVVISHHCPIEHSHFDSGTGDNIHHGDTLSKKMDKHNFSLFIHGHKHDPRLRTLPGGANAPYLFSSGSFSAFQSKLLLGATNTFHIIEIYLDGKFKGKGKIKTWFFAITEGWTTNDNQYFNHEVGFGAYADINEMSVEICNKIKASNGQICAWDEILNSFPSVNFLMTEDIKTLKTKLGNLGILFSSDLPSFLQYKER